MNGRDINWENLRKLRDSYLGGTAGAGDYWQSPELLADYDATFAQRIGWKWDHVLAELKRRGWSPPGGDVLDWGCGSGVAGRAVLDHFGHANIRALTVWDRSTSAMQFAADRARSKYPGLKISCAPVDPVASGSTPTTLVISHVLSELTQEETEKLAALAASAECVLWVEPGTYETSLTLIAIRERLRERTTVIAPCTHGARCGILAPENERHWCHHFASPPPEVFTDADWARFANETGIDLRDLPLSYLVLDRRGHKDLPDDALRVIGHPRLYKAHALVLGCDAAGVSERRLSKRAFPQVYKAMKKGDAPSLCRCRCAGAEIESFEKL